MSEKIGDDPSQAIVPRTTVLSYSKSFESPIPPPDILAQYAQIIPDAPNRFMSIWEQQVAHRFKQDNAESRRANYGLGAAVMLALLIITVGILMVVNGYSWQGTVVIGVKSGGLVGAFIYRSHILNNNKTRPIDN